VEPPPEIKPDPVKNKPDFTLVERKNPKETTKQAKNTSKVSNTITNKPRISLDNPTVRTGPSKAAREAAAARERAAREAAERQKAINEGLAAITGTIRGNAAPATSVAGIGGGGGTGESYADYNSIIYSTYFHAWRPPEEVTDLEATVKVKIVIARDGSVISHSVQSRSGTPALDKSVEGALRRVHRIVPFPESWTDSQKTFLLNFNLKSKNRLG
jgi:TolA protein